MTLWVTVLLSQLKRRKSHLYLCVCSSLLNDSDIGVSTLAHTHTLTCSHTHTENNQPRALHKNLLICRNKQVPGCFTTAGIHVLNQFYLSLTLLLLLLLMMMMLLLLPLFLLLLILLLLWALWAKNHWFLLWILVQESETGAITRFLLEKSV